MLLLLTLLALADEPLFLDEEVHPVTGEPLEVAPVPSKLQAPKPAPALTVTHWITGGPVALDDPDATYVIEVWATWCGPCRDSFPVLTALSTAYRGRVRVIALTDEDPLHVRRFYDRNRADMRYAIATDTTAVTLKALMFGGYEGSGMPSAYVIRGGQVLWSGPPDKLRNGLQPLLSEQGASEAPK